MPNKAAIALGYDAFGRRIVAVFGASDDRGSFANSEAVFMCQRWLTGIPASRQQLRPLMLWHVPNLREPDILQVQ